MVEPLAKEAVKAFVQNSDLNDDLRFHESQEICLAGLSEKFDVTSLGTCAWWTESIEWEEQELCS